MRSLNHIIDPAPTDAPPLPDFRYVKKAVGSGFDKYRIEHTWAYRSPTGALRCYVVRYMGPDGKETPQYTLWDTSDGAKWVCKGLPEPRPLYNLPLITHHPDATIVIVEGEKCAELAGQCFEGSSKIIFSCWIGGSNGVYKADWSPLAGRKIYLWPDADKQKKNKRLLPVEKQPGMKAMLNIAGVLQGIGCEMKLVNYNLEGDLPHGWDVADGVLDDGWGAKEIHEHIRNNAVELPDDLPKPPPLPLEKDTARSSASSSADTSDALPPFRLLGVSGGRIYIQLKETQEITSISDRKITHKDELVSIAPMQFWETNFFGRNGVDWTLAGDKMLRTARSLPIFCVNETRGKGAWREKDAGLVVNLGDSLLVEGEKIKIFDHHSPHVYEIRPPAIKVSNGEVMRSVDSIQYLEIMKMLNWDRDIYAYYLAGWAALAPLCGAWSWRPNLWLTAQQGSGKTWILNEMVAPALGGFALNVTGNTSEAGIRQRLGCDAMPVIFDETESENKDGRRRIQHILELIRQSASDSQALTIKGSGNGGAIIYNMRSMFLLASIGVSLVQAADKSRITVLHVRKKTVGAKEHFAALKKQVYDLLVPEYCERLRHRVRSLYPKVKKNAETFAQAVSEVADRRTGDQVGMLLAGAYALSASSEISLEDAGKWVENHDWAQDEFVPDPDERSCLLRILEYEVAFSNRRYSVEELILAAKPVWFTADAPEVEGISTEEALDTLKRHGITLQGQIGDKLMVVIANTHSILAGKVLSGSSWETGHSVVLQRLPGAQKLKSVKFHGTTYRAVAIPWETVFNAV